MSERQLGFSLDYFVLKEQRQAINENFEGVLIRKHEQLIKRKRGKDKDEQEDGAEFYDHHCSRCVGSVRVRGGQSKGKSQSMG